MNESFKDLFLPQQIGIKAINFHAKNNQIHVF